MQTTPLWVPIVVAGIGVIGTIAAGIAGVLITQRRSDRREDKVWQRERDREHERWARDDAARTFEHRRQAYVEFYDSLKALARKAYDHGYGFTDNTELPFDWHADAASKLQRLELYADRRVASAASAAYGAAWGWGQNTTYDDLDDPEFYERQERYDDAQLELLVLMREALSIPEGDITLAPPGYSYEYRRSPQSEAEPHDDDPPSGE